MSTNPPKLKLASPAKLNLCLDVLSRDGSGFHTIRTIFHALPNVNDELLFFESQEPDDVSIVHEDQKSAYTPYIPMYSNLAYHALILLKRRFHVTQNAKIVIKKHIPFAAGLGGGSSNAAATLKGLNQLWNLQLSDAELAELAAEIGMDVPFFICGGTALGEHYGEKITPLKPLKGLSFELIPQKKEEILANKTEQKYSALDLKQCGKNTELTEKMIAAIQQGETSDIEKFIHNDFSQLYTLKEGQHLTGSGPLTFKLL